MKYLFFALGVTTGFVLAWHHDKRPYSGASLDNVVRLFPDPIYK